MPAITFYDGDSGEITGTLDGPPSVLDVNKIGRYWVGGRYEAATHYIDAGVATERPVNPAQLDGLTLTDLPVPSMIHINGVAYECNDTSVELGFDQPGSYAVRVQAWPYLDAEFSIENPAP
ncbi:hypothetical protein [Castellaniella sp.]|uniref:hypothetical protein n=1 Tax=Castellaniella sp. TaxID=1955812 RepID=UPI00355D24D1